MVNPLALKPVFVSRVDREMLDPSLQLKEKEEKEKQLREMELHMNEQRKEITNQMVSEAILKDKEATEKEAVLAMDSDANLPSSSSSDAEEADVGEEESKTAMLSD